jgi:hypothetical protein
MQPLAQQAPACLHDFLGCNAPNHGVDGGENTRGVGGQVAQHLLVHLHLHRGQGSRWPCISAPGARREPSPPALLAADALMLLASATKASASAPLPGAQRRPCAFSNACSAWAHRQNGPLSRVRGNTSITAPKRGRGPPGSPSAGRRAGQTWRNPSSGHPAPPGWPRGISATATPPTHHAGPHEVHLCHPSPPGALRRTKVIFLGILTCVT